MACAVLRKRVSTVICDGPPLKRSRSSLLATSSLRAVNMGDILSLVSQRSSSASDMGTNSQINQGQSGTKRKREASPDQPSKRQCLHSTSYVPNTSDNTQLGPSTAEAMDTSEVTTPATSNNRHVETPQIVTDADGADDQAEAAVPADVELEGAVAGAAAPTEQLASAALTVQFENDFELICEIHPDIDPIFIREKLTLLINDPHRVSTVTFDLYDNVEAPKREHREALEVVQQEYERLINMPFDLNKFLKRYPDPLATFDVKDTDVTEIYYEYAEVFLKNEFRSLQGAHITKTLQYNGFHLTPTYKVLKNGSVESAYRGDKRKKNFKGKFCMLPRSETYEYPQGRDVIDEDFFWERLFVLNQEEILGYMAGQKEAKQLRLEEAMSEGRLRECTICASSEVLLEDMVTCPNEHLFCIDCVRHSTIELLGQGRASFPCLDAECGCPYPLATLEKCMKPETCSLVVRRVQSEELRLAELEDIASCPFCPYAVVMPDDISSSVFHCENPLCMEDSCRKCEGVAHMPYSCEEIKSKKESEYKHFVENQMADAMIRNCPKCDLRFVKDAGCNQMQCSKCRTAICYVCRKEITGCNHFRRSPMCSQNTDANQLHRNEISKAFKESNAKYREKHPELKNTNIVFAEYNLLEALKI